MNFLASVLTVGVFLGGSTTSFAEKYDFLDSLDLSQDQQSNLKSLKDKYRGNLKTKREALTDLQKDLDSSFEKNAGDEDLKKTFLKVQNLKRDLESLRFERRLEMRKVLTPDQRTKFHSIIKERRYEWKNRRSKD